MLQPRNRPWYSVAMNLAQGFVAGVLIGVLGGLIGLGGAEFRLPILLGWFGFAAIPAIILNKTMSLIVVGSALAFRTNSVPFDQVAAHWDVIVNVLAGTLISAWVAASWATRASSHALHRVMAVLLFAIALVLLTAHSTGEPEALLSGGSLRVAGVVAGLVIGAVAALLGVAGGELLIPTLVVLFGLDVKLAGSLSLAISLPTMLVSFARYSQDQSFAVLRQNVGFVLAMAAGSILGTFVGAHLLAYVSASLLIPALAAILVVSAVKVWR